VDQQLLTAIYPRVPRTHHLDSTPGRQQRPISSIKDKAANSEFLRDKYNDSTFDIKVKVIFVKALKDIDGFLYNKSHVQTYLTHSGLRVHISQVVTFDVEVWLFYGTSSPMILRPDQGDKYSFISQTLTYKSSGKVSDITFRGIGNEEKVNVIAII
jgi:hypothetical protein